MKPGILLTALTITFCLSSIASDAAVTSVIVTPPAPSVVKGNSYYLAGVQYDFRVQVTDPAASARSYYSYVDLSIPLDASNTLAARWTAPAAAGAGSYSITSGGGSSLIEAASDGVNVSGTTMLSLRFRITFAYDINAPAGISQTPASRTISAAAVDDAASSLTGSALSVYGFCSQVKLAGMAQSGDAADGRINPHFLAGSFNVTGTLIYNISGADSSDTVQGTVGTISLYEDDDNNYATGNTATPYADTDGNTSVSITVPCTYFNGRALRPYYWRCQAALSPGGTSICRNSLQLINDRVAVTSISITQGGGRDNGSYHWRSMSVSGTRVTVNAQMQSSGGGMTGNTNFEINYSGGTSFTVSIPNGQTSATAVIPAASLPSPAEGSTSSCEYHVTSIRGGNHGDQGDGTIGSTTENTGDDQVDPTVTGADPFGAAAYTRQVIHWDNLHGPSVSTDDITTLTLSATSVAFTWTPALDTSDTSPHGDFYEYRLYYREADTLDSFKQWDGDNDAALRGLEAATTTNVQNLKIFTSYDFYLVGVDIFGNESPVTDREGNTIPTADYSTFKTTPYSIQAAVTDGITTYDNQTFITGSEPGDYQTRPLRAANIKVSLNIVTSGDDPETVRVWFTNDFTDNTDMVITGAAQVENAGGFIEGALDSSLAQKTAPNTWTAYLPTTSAAVQSGSGVRFVVETEKDGVRVFTDTNSFAEDPADPNNNEWSFYITTEAQFTPWPTRVFNNVLTRSSPTAYPAYYLSDDAYVTIRVYDIKGRPVVTILDKAYRRGGQNIKDQGWSGTNKSRRKLGIGLYYMHFKAKRVSDGKTILNDIKKIVIRK